MQLRVIFNPLKDPLDEAMRTKFICSVDNEAVLKTLFKLKGDELKFSNAIRVAQEVEEAAKVAKETVHGQPSTSVQKVYHANSKTSKTQEKKTACFRCGNSGHFSKACYLQLLQENKVQLSLKLIAEPVTHFAVKRRGKRWVNPLYNLLSVQYQVAEGSPLPVVGQFQSTASIDGKSPDVTFPVIVTKVPNLNLLGRLAMMKLKLTNLADTSFDGE